MDSLCIKSVTNLAVEIIKKERDCPTLIDPVYLGLVSPIGVEHISKSLRK